MEGHPENFISLKNKQFDPPKLGRRSTNSFCARQLRPAHMHIPSAGKENE
jgi:hypothetical protein